MKNSTVAQFAREILSMEEELYELRIENEELREYKRKYSELLDESIAHSKHMTVGMLSLAMKPELFNNQRQ